MNDADLAASVWRLERSQLDWRRRRLLHDLDEAEDCAQDALIAALETWPVMASQQCAAWLMTTTRNRALDRLRRRQMLAREQRGPGCRRRGRPGACDAPDPVPGLDLARARAAGRRATAADLHRLPPGAGA